MSLLHVHLYEYPSVKNLKLSEISQYLKEKLGQVLVGVRSAFITVSDELLDGFSERLASSKVRDLGNQNAKFEPLYGEIEYEKRILKEPSRRSFGILYDGFRLQAILRDMLGKTDVSLDFLKEKFRGRFIDYGDERLTEVMKGYVMQANLMLEPFCNDKRCRLYNAHWQEEVLEAQLKPSEFCEMHEQALEQLKRGLS